jgi:hypothetical protein
LRDAYHELNLTRLDEALVLFEKRQGRKAASLDELRESGVIRADADFKDPWGGNYYLDAQSGEVTSTSNHKRLRAVRK